MRKKSLRRVSAFLTLSRCHRRGAGKLILRSIRPTRNDFQELLLAFKDQFSDPLRWAGPEDQAIARVLVARLLAIGPGSIVQDLTEDGVDGDSCKGWREQQVVLLRGTCGAVSGIASFNLALSDMSVHVHKTCHRGLQIPSLFRVCTELLELPTEL